MIPSRLVLFITPSVLAMGVYALPVNSTTAAAAASEIDIDDLRSLYDIVWRCLATIFACTWLAVHPNVPNERIRTKGAFYITLQRVKLAGLAIIAPEVILIWAMRQWRIARKVKCRLSLTMTHGFMLSMGGFVDASGRLIYKVSHLHCEDLPSKDELQDRSKNDALAKLIVVLQTLWFVIGCILRGVRALDISQLEVLTLAFASLNAVTYAVWWHKPMDVTVPIRLSYSYTDSAGSSVVTLVDRLPDAAERAPLNTSDYVSTSSSTLAEDVMSQTAQLGLHGALTTGECDSTTTPLPFVHLEERSEDITDCRLNPWLETEQYDRQVTDYHRLPSISEPSSSRWPVEETWLVKAKSCYRSSKTAIYRFHERLSKSFDCVVSLFGKLAFQGGRLSTAIMLGDRSSSSHLPGALTAPRDADPGRDAAVAYAGCAFGVVFGGLHCLAWNSPFPTLLESFLWRTSALMVTILPALYPCIYIPLQRYHAVGQDASFSIFLLRITTIIRPHFFIPFLYVFARLSLVTLSFTALRDLPPSAYQTVQWTYFIPHF